MYWIVIIFYYKLYEIYRNNMHQNKENELSSNNEEVKKKI